MSSGFAALTKNARHNPLESTWLSTAIPSQATEPIIVPEMKE